MKKHFEHRGSSVEPQAGMDLAAMINKMQQQLVFLEKKIDTLISQSSQRPSEGRHFPKPFQRFDHSRRHERGNQDNSFRGRNYTQVICADCNKECEVPFKPSADRPVYCRECFAKRKNSGTLKQRQDNKPKEEYSAGVTDSDKERSGKSRKSAGKKKTISRKRK